MSAGAFDRVFMALPLGPRFERDGESVSANKSQNFFKVFWKNFGNFGRLGSFKPVRLEETAGIPPKVTAIASIHAAFRGAFVRHTNRSGD